ncbi:MAG: queuosine salvage family protein [Deltaproteobacteria bacterium]|nr:queuosine salvage family protein [Deltaproteobacteria bacterium]
MNEPGLDFSTGGGDPLGILAGSAHVLGSTTALTLDPGAVSVFAARYAGGSFPPPDHDGPEEALHCRFLPPGRFLNYLLVLEALNFSFWDDEPRWRVDWEGRQYDGYWALAAALRRALVHDGIPLWDARWMAELENADAARLLRGCGRPGERPVPMLEQRVENLREAGRVLLQNFAGEFAVLLEAAGGNAVNLVRLVVEHFPSFRDEAVWNGRPVPFHKRAQILAADLARLYPAGPDDQGGLRLADLDQLTAFADYKVPQVLCREGIIVPSEQLRGRMDAGEELAPGCEEELALRAGTVWGCEWIVRALNKSGGTGTAPVTAPVTAADVDHLLWCAGQDKSGLRPYHRTRTIYY